MKNLNTKTIAELQKKILLEVAEIKVRIIENIGMGDWLPRRLAMKFLEYEDTAMAALEKSGAIEFSKIGRRKFFRKSAIIELLNKNIQ